MVMCGIGGICASAHLNEQQHQQAAVINFALKHRGPDGHGQVSTETSILVHRRLSIVGLHNGSQPMILGDLQLVGNNEIYNDPSLREAELQDVKFSTDSDTESAVHLYNRYGPVFCTHLRGMYALAIQDGQRQLVLSRDPFGIKPLYYAKSGDNFAFSSEPQALLAAGFGQRSVRKQAAAELFNLQYTTERETIFPGIDRVLPGETLIYSPGQKIQRLFVQALELDSLKCVDEADALDRFECAWLDSLSVHLRADVPVGLFLSGGVDSLAVLHGVQRLHHSNNIVAWTACYDVADSVDESAKAAELAQQVGVEHRILRINQKLFWDNLPRIIACMDDPAADYAIIPTWFLAREAAKDVKVILCGEGGDELLGGYGRYRASMRPRWLGGKPMYRKGILEKESIQLTRLWKQNVGRYSGISPAKLTQLQKAQLSDISHWLPNDLLLKLDRCLMAHGVEGRTPFLDPVVSKTVFGLPDQFKIRGKNGKWVLRRWLQREWPQTDPFSYKQGFTVPVGSWIKQKSPELAPALSRLPCLLEWFAPETIETIIGNADKRDRHLQAWILLFYALWHRIHVEGYDADQPIEALLNIYPACPK